MNDFLQNLRGGQKDNRAAAKTRRGFDNNSQQPNYNSSSHFHSNGSYQNPRVGNGKRPMRTNPQNQMPMDPNPMMPSSEVIENIMVLADTMIKNQEFLAAVHERRAAAEERKADSLEEIAEYLRVIAVPQLADDAFQDGEYQEDAPVEEVFVKSAPQPVYQEAPQAFQEPEPVVPVKKRRGRKPKALKLAEEKAAAEKAAAEKIAAADVPEEKKVKVLKRTKAEKLKIADQEEARTEIMSREAVMEIVNSMRKDGATFDQVAQRLVSLGQPTFSGRGEWHAQTVHRLCNTKK
ncbi:hypothetical protein HRM2_10760 [Desulforapulum autotrophicum HRM2]|uniref:Recombinase domain-containing protein n=1 Tax=Desulforapulum autotrophicum (strain ATCC 43914 / DSM 3382 / VKM B-1955 / HRM2) TaxID=177437 RepID=C0QLA2_DESAH|nr:hypothetical protein [Desulforapulum autotrophicum]ACN14188.1 hypothetical protein HRM2_10760 [Desulforapulum autotrophicum HRM2]